MLITLFAALTATLVPHSAIFMYHHVSMQTFAGPYAKALTTTPTELRAQLTWLRQHDCTAVSVDKLLQDLKQQSSHCEAALTFDDGYEDVAQYALPMLREFDAVGTFYISTGFVGQTGHVSMKQLRALQDAGMEIGAHTVHHLDLTTVSSAELQAEIRGSGDALRRWLGIKSTSFAYPAGKLNASVAAAVKSAGFNNAVSTQPGYVTAQADPYALPRYRIVRGEGLALISSILGARTATSDAAPVVERALEHIARERIAGNAPQIAEPLAQALLARRFPEQILKVHVLALPPATVAGIMLSGVKFHGPVDRRRFNSDIHTMVQVAFAAAPQVNEIDVWASVPIAVPAGAPVSGDFAVPTSKTVFSAAVVRRASDTRQSALDWGTMYWDPMWLK